jgi:hypothetical protein
MRSEGKRRRLRTSAARSAVSRRRRLAGSRTGIERCNQERRRHCCTCRSRSPCPKRRPRICSRRPSHRSGVWCSDNPYLPDTRGRGGSAAERLRGPFRTGGSRTVGAGRTLRTRPQVADAGCRNVRCSGWAIGARLARRAPTKRRLRFETTTALSAPTDRPAARRRRRLSRRQALTLGPNRCAEVALRTIGGGVAAARCASRAAAIRGAAAHICSPTTTARCSAASAATRLSASGSGQVPSRRNASDGSGRRVIPCG